MKGQEKSNVQKTTSFPPCIHPFYRSEFTLTHTCIICTHTKALICTHRNTHMPQDIVPQPSQRSQMLFLDAGDKQSDKKHTAYSCSPCQHRGHVTLDGSSQRCVRHVQVQCSLHTKHMAATSSQEHACLGSAADALLPCCL
ncbi:hypothetical protein MRX96_004424 [Rhipicephalus microplus]